MNLEPIKMITQKRLSIDFMLTYTLNTIRERLSKLFLFWPVGRKRKNALELDRFDFILMVERDAGLYVVRKYP